MGWRGGKGRRRVSWWTKEGQIVILTLVLHEVGGAVGIHPCLPSVAPPVTGMCPAVWTHCALSGTQALCCCGHLHTQRCEQGPAGSAGLEPTVWASCLAFKFCHQWGKEKARVPLCEGIS